MSYDPLVTEVEVELLRLAKEEAKDWEVVRWLGWVGDCFDGGDFAVEEFNNLRWRLNVVRVLLGERRIPILGTETEGTKGWVADPLIAACQRVLDGPRAIERAGFEGFKDCGNLYTVTPPFRQ